MIFFWAFQPGVWALAAGLLLWERSDPGRLSVFESADAAAAEAARGSFFPSLATSGAGGLPLSADDIRDVKSCATCHRQITEDWKRSAHRHASMTNPFYRASIEDLRTRFPPLPGGQSDTKPRKHHDEKRGHDGERDDHLDQGEAPPARSRHGVAAVP